MSDPAPVVRPGPDPDRDARVARRRAADARRAGRALDRFISDLYEEVMTERYGTLQERYSE